MRKLTGPSITSRQCALRNKTWLIALCTVVAASTMPCRGTGRQAPESYMVGPEDVVNVAVARHPEFSGEFYVPPDGVITLPAAGPIRMDGKTLPEIAEAITAALRARLRSPEVTVTLRTPHRQQVYVLGAVVRSGPYEMTPDWHCSEAIAAAGGLAPDVDPNECQASIRRAATGQSEPLSLAAILKQENGATDPVLRNGDTLKIDAPEVMPVYVTGKVRNPGLYKLRKDRATVLEALTLAGGELDNSALSRVSITRASGTTELCDLVTAISSGKTDAAPKLQPLDVVIVPEDTGKVAVIGYVNEPGIFQVKSTDTVRLMDAIGQAKGPARRSNIGSVAVVRTEAGRQQRMIYDLGKFLRSGDIAQNPILRPGDVVYVPQTGSPNWDSVLGSIATAVVAVNPFLR